jgi:hypothetical protein
MHHDRLVDWINDPEISPSRRRLYFTMLGVCGTASDLPMLEALIKSDFQELKPQLEQAVQSALALGAPSVCQRGSISSTKMSVAKRWAWTR